MSKQIKTDVVEDLARQMRRDIVSMAARGKTSHVGSALSCADILAVLYARSMNITADNWKSPEADRFILSKGHGAKAWYAVLAQHGFFPVEKLAEYSTDGSHLGEHPSHHVPGILVSTGSLGHGLSVGIGMALAQRLDGRPTRTFVLMSDGECNEGAVWEAAMTAANLKLDNVVAIIDDNQWQALGRSREVNALEPFAAKWEAFGWDVYGSDGHDIDQLAGVLTRATSAKGKPKVIIARTVLGKGVSFMEDDLLWHYQVPSPEQLHAALKELA